MRQLDAKSQRWLKCFHVLFCSVWAGAAVSLLTINLFMKAGDGMELYGINASMKFIDDFVIIPGAVGCFLTGLLYSLFTPWGWFKHHWITIKWCITLFGILSGTFLLGPKLNSLAPLAKAEGLPVLANPVYVSTKHLLYSAGGFQVATLLFALFISILRPWKKKVAESAEANRLAAIGCDESGRPTVLQSQPLPSASVRAAASGAADTQDARTPHRPENGA